MNLQQQLWKMDQSRKKDKKDAETRLKALENAQKGSQ